MKKLKSTAGVDAHLMEGYKVLPKVDTDKYPEIPGLEGPFQTMAGKPIYYDPKEGSYYDKDTDMYLTYDEFKALDNDRTGMKEASMPVNATPKMHKLDVQEDAPISQMSRADLLDYLNMSEKDAEGISTQELMDMAQDVTMDQMEGTEDDEFDPSNVKANVMKHLKNMYNDAKKDGGYTSEKMRLELYNLLHDMATAGYMDSDYYDIEGFFHKGIDIKADEKINMGMLKKAYAQAKNLPDDTRVDPDIFTRGGSAMKSVATESKSMLGEVTRSLTEAEFDEAAGEKDACYKKVKSRYKVWPSAYASGALVKCRKVGAANWGNKSKK
jgi:hypothetical protein